EAADEVLGERPGARRAVLPEPVGEGELDAAPHPRDVEAPLLQYRVDVPDDLLRELRPRPELLVQRRPAGEVEGRDLGVLPQNLRPPLARAPGDSRGLC